MADAERGLFIVLEGIDNCGKTTQSDLLADYLRRANYPVVCSREPGGTLVGEKIREIILKRDEMLDPKTQTLLFYAARNEYINQVVLFSVGRGITVISDRFEPSTYAYQVYTQGVDVNFFHHLQADVLGHHRPDLCIILDITAAESKKRESNKDNQNQQLVYEKQGPEFTKSLRQGYILYARNYQGQDVFVVNGMNSREDVHSRVIDLVNMKISRLRDCGINIAKQTV